MDPTVYVSACTNRGRRCKCILFNTSPLPQASKRALKKTQRRPAGHPTPLLVPLPASQLPSPLFIRSSPPLLTQPDAIEEEEEEEEENNKEKEEQEEEKED